MENYIAQRLAAIGGSSEIDALREENARLKEQLGQLPGEFKSEAQAAFEQSPEFEGLLNHFYMRMLRDKYGADFRGSAHMQAFQTAANALFAEFEKNYKKEGAKIAQAGKKAAGNGAANAGSNDGK